MSLVKQHNNNSSGHHSRSKTPFFSGVQAKLNVGKPGDKYEKEADQVADQIVAGKNAPEQTPFFSPAPNVNKKGEDEQEVQQKPLGETITPLVQLKEDKEIQSKEEEEIQQQEEEEAVQTKAEEEDVQMQEEEEAVQAKSDDEDLQTSIADFNIQEKPMFSKDIEPNVQKKSEEEIQEKEDEEVQEKEEEESIQKSADTGTDSSPGSSFENNLSQSKGGGSPMDNSTREGMESGFGKDFSGVRIHNDDNAVQMNKDLGSQAFTNGNDIYFNEGKYNPGTKEGDHLLAHELTHTVQQGASTDPSQSVQKQEQAAGEPQESTRPGTPIDITHRFELTDAWAQYLDGEYENGERSFEVDVKIGERYSGTILVRKLSSAEGETAKYDLVHTSRQNYLEINGWSFLDPLRQAGVTPILVLKRFGDEQTTKGFLSAKIGDTALTSDVLGIVKGINENLEAMQFLGIEPIEIPTGGMENTFEAGRLLFQVSTMSTVVDGFLEAGGGMGITGDAFTFNLNANVDVAGLASGEFTIARGEDGKLSGTGQIQAEIANVQATISVEYIDGAVTIQGTGRIESEKFSGEITLLVTDEQKSKQMMHAALGVETMDAEAESSETEAAPKTRNNQVLAGWGEVTASITPWLEGTAKVGIDADGHVTIVGEIVVPEEIELMEQRGKKVDIFSVEIRAGYGIPLVGQVFLFASIGMFMNAGFGPLVLKDVGFTGTYSTDPSVLQEFAVTGTLGINAFAVLGLEAEAGVGLTLLGHDVKAGVNVTAAAGLRAYAEATPTLEYKEQATPEGGKAGETRLKGHFEAAAQLFLQLSGALFVELDSPWWSPAPDGREEYPLGEVQYPIGDSMGIGADMDWLVGSNEIPELSFSPVEFDPDKFTADVMADPPPRKRGNSDAEEAGQWEDGNSPGNQSENPEMRDGEGLPKNDKKEEDLKNLPDEQKYMRALDEMSKLENANPKPTEAVVNAKATKVKRKYGIDRIQVTPKGDEAEIFVKHKREDNGNHKLKVPLMSEAERMKLLQDAQQDLRKESDKAADEDGTIEESAARELLNTWKSSHPVIEDANVKDAGTRWDYELDLGDRKEVEQGNQKKVAEEEQSEENPADGGPSIIGMTEPVNVDGGHNIKIEGSVDRLVIKVHSDPKTLDEIITLKTEELKDAKGMDPDYEKRSDALDELKSLNTTLATHVEAYRVATKTAYDKGSKKSDITTAHGNVQSTLGRISRQFVVLGVELKDWVRPESKVLHAMENGMAKRVIAQPLTHISGNTSGSPASTPPKGWTSIDEKIRIPYWVKAHLLNHNLHGPGDQVWNLFPGTKQMNTPFMLDQVEAPAKERAIDNREVLYYNVVLTYGNSGDYNFIPTEVYMEYGEYDSINQKRGKLHKRVTFKQDPPSEDALEINNLNSSSSQSLGSIANANGMSGMTNFFSKIAKGRQRGVYTNKRSNIKSKVKSEYADGSQQLETMLDNLMELIEDGKIVV